MKKILIIEDDSSIRENLTDLLEAYNFKVFCAKNGKEGVDLAKELVPDLILCDIMMPIVNGYQVKEFLELNSNLSRIPFIYMTAKSELKEIRKGMLLGADDYLVKPFENEELIEAIKVRLNRYKKIAEENISEFDQSNQKRKLNISEKILVSVDNQPKMLDLNHIIYIKSAGNYSTIYVEEDEKMMIRKLLKEWETILPDKEFIRIHNSIIVNINYLEKIEKMTQRSFIVKLKTINEPLPVSQRYTSKIKSKFEV